MSRRPRDDGKLTLFDACGMAIGGMVGGGLFATVNLAAVIHREFRGWGLVLPIAGAAGCAAAAVLLAASQYRERPELTWALVGTALALLAVRGVDLTVRRGGS